MAIDAPRPTAARPAGIGLRGPHVAEILATRPRVGWLEIHAENYMGAGPSLRALERIRAHYPLALHGIGLSLGGADPVDAGHLDRLRRLVDRLQPTLVSEHLAWSAVGGVYLNHLLPLPYTEESLAVVSAHVARAQEALGRPILMENPAAYLRFRHSTIAEPDFLNALARTTGCGLLCDVNNIHVSAHNLGFDPLAYLEALAPAAVGEIHLAGHAVNDAEGCTVLIDDHGAHVAPAVWRLYARACAHIGPRPTLVEWDTNLPPLDVLVEEARRAEGWPRERARSRMPSLRELQTGFCRALLAGDGSSALGPEIVEDGVAVEARLAIYRHHVLASLTDVLASTYPVVCRLVDRRFFAYLADAFIHQHPPAGPCLFEYGAPLADFVAAFPPCRHLGYLGDVARLEWALHVAAHADEAIPLAPAALAGVDATRAGELRFTFEPSLSLVSSPWPVDAIWRANQEGADGTVDLDAGGVRLEVLRRGEDVVMRSLAEAVYGFRGELLAGESLATAAGRALAADPAFDLGLALVALVQDGVLTGVRDRPMPGAPPP